MPTNFSVTVVAFFFSEFYTGWLTHWGERIATTDAGFTAKYLDAILSRNGSAVLYVCSLPLWYLLVIIFWFNVVFEISDGTWWNKLGIL